MRVSLIEPVSTRYLHLNQETNRVHLLVPIVGGQEISTDNTCRSKEVQRAFFEGGAVQALTAYQKALISDIQFIQAGDEVRKKKEERLAQIEAYLHAVAAMRRWEDAIETFLKKETNLYSIQLRPRVQDSASHVIHPVFTLNRKNDAEGNPLSLFYREMYAVFPGTSIHRFDPRTRIQKDVLENLPKTPSFEQIQRVLGERCQVLFESTVDFTTAFDGRKISQESIDTLMNFDETVTRENYIETLLNACASNLWESLPISPFYKMTESMSAEIRTERLSMMTQFFLAVLNVYCKSRGLSDKNFGQVLDGSLELSRDLVNLISETLSEGEDVVMAVCNFCNVYAVELGLNRALNQEDLDAIRQKFERTYRTISESPHLDDFMILDLDAKGERAKCVTHQGSICVNFVEIVDPALLNQEIFEATRKDFKQHSAEILPRDEPVIEEVEVGLETLFQLYDQEVDTLSDAMKAACRADPAFRLKIFLHDAAKGRQDEVEGFLRANPRDMQTLLTTAGSFTDYSGRTFNCTAYEYAYWAKDTHMCRMLETYMDEETKAFMWTRIQVIKNEGLVYSQNGKEHCSAHFDLTPLTKALEDYANSYRNLRQYPLAGYRERREAFERAWMAIGKAQRDVPAHVAQAYCKDGIANESTLPRDLTFYNAMTQKVESWFPLRGAHSGLGFDFVLVREQNKAIGKRHFDFATPDCANGCLDAVTCLDEAKTIELIRLENQLKPPEVGLDEAKGV